ncbi:MAG: signal peptidase I [Vicinamibacteraceae bacterium]
MTAHAPDAAGADAQPAWAVPAPLPIEPSYSGDIPSAALPPVDATQAEPAAVSSIGASPFWKRFADEVFTWFKTLASAAVYATLIVTFGLQVARVEGQSMAPTLADQDRLIVNKLVYRMHDPEPGDIVMLWFPQNPEKSFVKRIIGGPGDEVQVVDGHVFVNKVPVRDDYVPREYRGHDDWGPERIPDGYYFVLGDHRNNSSDSRHWGWVPKKYVIGKVHLRWWPVGHARVFE